MRRVITVGVLALAAFPCARAEGPAPIGTAEVCFTLAGVDCGAFAVAWIGRARRSLLVQAYDFTEPRIVDAVIAAKDRGVAVTVLVDKKAAHQRGEGVDRVADAGVPTFVDIDPRIAHNKVMVIDDTIVLTGSFNWTVSAERYNAENLLAVRSPELADFYAANFARRRALSVAYRGVE